MCWYGEIWILLFLLLSLLTNVLDIMESLKGISVMIELASKGEECGIHMPQERIIPRG